MAASDVNHAGRPAAMVWVTRTTPKTSSSAMFVLSLGARLKDKGVEGNMKGDGLVQGGIVVLGPAPECAVLYTYYEETGKQIPVLELDAAIAKAVGR